MNRITTTFSNLSSAAKPALIPFIMAGDPDVATCRELLMALPEAGADLIELGMPFSDPTADGPSIQKAGLRALQAGTKLKDVLALVTEFRRVHQTPIILMGYYNPVLHYGLEAFTLDAAAAGVDALILVDLPPEEEDAIRPLMDRHGLALVRLIAPTTGDERLATVAASASGFVYTIAIKGITGTASASAEALTSRVAHIRRFTNLPIVAGFGIRTSEQANALKDAADGIVVGSALVDALAQGGVTAALSLMRDLHCALKE